MSLNSILANKIGMLFDSTRNEPRDVYDIWFLLKHVSRFDFDYNRVKQLTKNKYGIMPTLSLITASLNNQSLKKNWKIRLSMQIAQLPDYHEISSDINAYIKELDYR
jgi:hypothetical protein